MAPSRGATRGGRRPTRAGARALARRGDRPRPGAPLAPGARAAVAVEHAGRVLVALHDQARPLAPVDEQVVEAPSVDLGEVDRVDQDQLATESPYAPASELEVAGVADLSARGHEAHPPAGPAGDVLALEATGQDRVDADHEVEPLVVEQRLCGEHVHHAAVRVQVVV